MLAFYDDVWALDIERCPCDAHFVEWLDEQNVRDAAIFHFGTGLHHYVGMRVAERRRGNVVLGITAAPKEYEKFIELAIERPDIERCYKAVFGDIYQLDARLLPSFDVVTLFHLCEYRDARGDAYGAMTDLELALLLTDKLRPDGHLLFYTRSFAFARTQTVIDELTRRRPELTSAGAFKTLQLLRKAA